MKTLRLREYSPDRGQLREQDSGRIVAYMAVDAENGALLTGNPEMHRSTRCARRIVHCVNRFDDLIAALRDVTEDAHASVGSDRWSITAEAFARVRAVLATEAST